MEDSLRECNGCDKCPQSQQILCILDYVKENNELLTLILSKLNILQNLNTK